MFIYREIERGRRNRERKNSAFTPLFRNPQESAPSSEKSSKKDKRKTVKKKKMQCDECNEDLVGTYFERDGKNICEKDYEVGVLSKKESFSVLYDP